MQTTTNLARLDQLLNRRVLTANDSCEAKTWWDLKVSLKVAFEELPPAGVDAAAKAAFLALDREAA